MKLWKPLAKVSRKFFYTRTLFRKLSVLLNTKHTYYPSLPQKSRLRIFADQLMWIFKNRELNHFYYVYGLDRRDPEKAIEIMPYRQFTKIRDKANLSPTGLNFNYACLLRDKFMFGQFLSSLNIPTPKNIALIDTKGITWLSDMRRTSSDAIATHGEIDGFCKKLLGLQGEGAFPLSVSNGKLYTGNTEVSVQEFRRKIAGTYLLQERITQHQAMSVLHANSINTMRIITFNNGGNIEVFGAVLRVGAHGSNVDNWNAGGISIAIDINSGRLKGAGMYKPGHGGRVEKQPDSGVEFSGFQLPCFHESVDLVCKVHRYLYGVHSIGWDVAITNNGPILIEGNEDWGGGFTMRAVDNFKTRFLKMYENRNPNILVEGSLSLALLIA